MGLTGTDRSQATPRNDLRHRTAGALAPSVNLLSGHFIGWIGVTLIEGIICAFVGAEVVSTNKHLHQDAVRRPAPIGSWLLGAVRVGAHLSVVSYTFRSQVDRLPDEAKRHWRLVMLSILVVGIVCGGLAAYAAGTALAYAWGALPGGVSYGEMVIVFL
ncbi:hypothetical protein BD413DRAFT_553084 [Trametes elegans]|nr:hypothetical protein BD413DRAFT_553084 [Trametes elegans]